MKKFNFDKLRERLEKLTWPDKYLFKFIVPAEKVGEVVSILPDEDIYTTRRSTNGNYVSVTSYIDVGSEQEVIEVYEKAAGVEGIISL